MFRFFSETPLSIALVGAHFLLYSLPAWAILAVRMVSGRLSRKEWALFAVFAGALLLECVQLAVDGFRFFGTDKWGLPRYFGVFAPLMWLWVAWALARLWCLPIPLRWRWAVRGVVVAALAWMFVTQHAMSFARFYRKGARYDTVVAAKRIAPVIRADYKGPRRQREMKRSLAEYFTARRPVVFSDFAAAAWEVRGQSEGACQGGKICPYPDDYLFIRVGSGYGGIKTVDSRQYDYVRSVRGGLGTEWRLFRRKAKR